MSSFNCYIFNDYDEFLNKYLEFIKKYKGKFGCVLTFEGFVRDYDIKNGEKVPSKGMHIDEDIFKKLESIVKDAKNRFDIIEILFYHNTGFLDVGERIASISVFARHREEGFKALRYIIDEMKKYH